MNYPRHGEPIVPHLLRPLVLERHPNGLPSDRDSDLIAHDELGADAWRRLPVESLPARRSGGRRSGSDALAVFAAADSRHAAAQPRSRACPADRAADNQHTPPRGRAAHR